MTRNNKPILHLNLKKEWFDIIGDPKHEEYRDVSPYWSRVFSGGKIKIKGVSYNPSDVVVCFSNGYTKNRPQKTFEITGLRVGFGDVKFGALHKKTYFIIQIGERLK